MLLNLHRSVESRLNTNCNTQTSSIDRELKPYGDIHGKTPLRSTDRNSCRQTEPPPTKVEGFSGLDRLRRTVGSFPTEVGGFKPDFWKMKFRQKN